MFSLWRILTGWLVLELVMIVILLLPCDKSGQTIFRKILAYRPFSRFTAYYVNAFYVIISSVVTMLLYATSNVWTTQSVLINKVDSNEVELNYDYLAACLSAVLCFLICIIISINVKLIQVKEKHEKLMRLLAEKALEVEDFSKTTDYRLVEVRTLKAAYDKKRDEICALKAKISETKSKCESLASTAAAANGATVGGENKKYTISHILSKCETLASLASTEVAASVGGEQKKNIISNILSKCETLASLATTKASTVSGESKKNKMSSDTQSQSEILTGSTVATNGGDIKKMKPSPSSQILSMCDTQTGLPAAKAATSVGEDQEKNSINSI